MILGDGAQQERNHLSQGKHTATTAPYRPLNILQPEEEEKEEKEEVEVTLRKYVSYKMYSLADQRGCSH